MHELQALIEGPSVPENKVMAMLDLELFHEVGAQQNHRTVLCSNRVNENAFTLLKGRLDKFEGLVDHFVLRVEDDLQRGGMNG